MAVPDFQSCMRPLLAAIDDGEPTLFNIAFDRVCQHFQLSEEDKNLLLASGKQTVIRNRTYWARTYMKKAGLLDGPARSYIQITDKGRQALKECPDKIDVDYLKSISKEFQEFQTPKAKSPSVKEYATPDAISDPRERLENAYQEIQASLIGDLLDQVRSNSWQFFEQLVVDLMLAMGYGGARKGAGQSTQLTNDDGIDGIINEDKLGLDSIYLQAKRWRDTVHRPEIDKFIGALTRQGARKGVFITTSDFSSGAREAATGLNISVVLIDGKQLAELKIQHDIGVSTKQAYLVKNIDSDYFSEDQ